MRFSQRFFSSLNPVRYNDLTRDGFSRILKHFIGVLVLLTIISSLMYLPKFMLVPYQVNNEFQKFEKFSIETDVVTKEPVDFGFVKIDTNSPPKEKIKGIFINDEILQVQFLPFGSPSSVKLTDLQDVLRNTETIRANMIILTALIMPYLFFLVLFYHGIKYLLLSVLVSIAIIMLIRTGKGEVSGVKVFKISLYGTVFMMLELFLQVFNLPWIVHTFMPFVIYVVFVLITTIYIMSYDRRKRPIEENIFKASKKDIEKDNGDIFSGTNLELEEEIDVDLIKKEIERSTL